MASGKPQPGPLANFTPSIWGEYFMAYEYYGSTGMENNKGTREIITELKNKVTKKMTEDGEKLDLVDAIQRLGVAFYFEKEIVATLQKLHESSSDLESNDSDLYTNSLCFRLLRQHGYNVCCDIFKKFMDAEGKFKESIGGDVRGLLSLYQASHLRVHGEDILDEALVFTKTQLKSIANSSLISSSLSAQINHALKHPIRKSIQSREARHFISVYEQDASHDSDLLTLAKLEFNLVQQLYQKELSVLARWWKDLDSRTEVLSFARDRIVESFYWGMCIFPEAEFSLIRTTLAKLVSFLAILDDIYDSFGTLEELELFTEAIERWDICATDKLPEYMKLTYKAVLEFFSEVEERVAKERTYWIDYAKKAMLVIVKAFFREAKWLHQKEIPTIDEYLPVAYDSAVSFIMILMAFTGMGDFVTKDSMDWLLNPPEPKIVRAMSIVSRIRNDVGYHKSEKRRSGHIVASAVDCYIKQYGVTEEEAVHELDNIVANAWRDVNEECLKLTLPRPLVMRILDCIRTSDDIYRDGDGFTQNELLKDMIALLVINPVPL